ncbi:uncharacterized protein LOC117600744 [Osmia lignaria lignaria]|uniref:uncharacterized protein LOC117600744 n=1 Tax=Osmia lignaria lignaria TaxID=1437193 RepID=UPI001478217D|nr:uncharacterized protein LOC117600744 [Osmia lignaria]
MAVRLASDTIRTLYAIKCMKKDSKHRSQSPVYKDNTPNTCKEENMRQTLSKSFTSSIHSESSDNALIFKVHPSDLPLRNDVKQRTECNELNDILAKWNVYKPKK